jgi:arylsulfatase
VLPLDDRIMERFLVPKPRPITSRNRFVYYDGAHVPSAAMPDVKSVSYRIVVEVDRRGDGVLVSCGDRFAGYALFVVDGHLVHDYNAAGTHHVVRSTTSVPSGRVRLEYRFRKSGELSGVGELYVDDASVGSADVPRTLGVHISPTGLTVGRAPVSPVSDLYEPPFRFDGVIDRVTIEIGDDRTASGPTTITALDD